MSTAYKHWHLACAEKIEEPKVRGDSMELEFA